MLPNVMCHDSIVNFICLSLEKKSFVTSATSNLSKLAGNLLSKFSAKLRLKRKISEICSELNVDGLRGDIVTNRAARALCAFEGRCADCLCMHEL